MSWFDPPCWNEIMTPLMSHQVVPSLLLRKWSLMHVTLYGKAANHWVCAFLALGSRASFCIWAGFGCVSKSPGFQVKHCILASFEVWILPLIHKVVLLYRTISTYRKLEQNMLHMQWGHCHNPAWCRRALESEKQTKTLVNSPWKYLVVWLKKWLIQRPMQ